MAAPASFPPAIKVRELAGRTRAFQAIRAVASGRASSFLIKSASEIRLSLEG
jgi:hypothetical protein